MENIELNAEIKLINTDIDPQQKTNILERESRQN